MGASNEESLPTPFIELEPAVPGANGGNASVAENFGSEKIPPRSWLDEIPGYTPHIVVKFQDWVQLPYTDDDEEICENEYEFPWSTLAEQFREIDLRRLFVSLTRAEIEKQVNEAVEYSRRTYKPPNFFTYYRIDTPKWMETRDIENLVSEIQKQEHVVETAYFDLPCGDPVVVASDDLPNAPLQEYLTAAPTGIGVQSAWDEEVDGTGEEFIDFEQGWALDHQDLGLTTAAEIGPGNNSLGSNFHGTAVLGIVRGVDNTQGIIGIAPNVSVKVGSYFNATSTADALSVAVSQLAAGGVLLIEAQILPHNYPLEKRKADWDEIEKAVAKGIVVVAAAGNGLPSAKDLSAIPDTGAIMVGAAGSVLRNNTNHDRHPNSNFGSRINCYAWGENVTTAWADNTGAPKPNLYTDCADPVPVRCFNGTSSAAAIIAGIAIIVQAIRTKRHGAGSRLTPADMRRLVCDPNNGTPIVAGGAEVGVMPDLAKIVPLASRRNPFGP